MIYLIFNHNCLYLGEKLAPRRCQLVAMRSPQPESGASKNEAAPKQYDTGNNGREAGRTQLVAGC